MKEKIVCCLLIFLKNYFPANSTKTLISLFYYFIYLDPLVFLLILISESKLKLSIALVSYSSDVYPS